MSDIGPYAQHQHGAPGAVRAHTLVGSPVETVNSNDLPTSSPAVFSTAPYKPPKEQAPESPKKGRRDTARTA